MIKDLLKGIVVPIFSHIMHTLLCTKFWGGAATVGCGQKPQYNWDHRTRYLRPEAAMIACSQRLQGS